MNLELIHLGGSVGPVWALWLVSSLGLGLVLARTGTRIISRRRRLRGEGGAGSTIGLVACFPILAVLVAVFLETSTLLTAKFGTIYAATAAARSFTAWEAEGPRASTLKAQQAATLAMATFVPTIARRSTESVPKLLRDRAAGFSQVAARSSGGRLTGEFLGQCYLDAARNTEVEFTAITDSARPGRRVATVRYTYPFTIGWLGRVLGTAPSGRGAGGPVREISTSVVFTAQEELPHGLGIAPLLAR